MRSEREDSAGTGEGDTQLAVLEKAVRFNRLLLFGLALLVGVLLIGGLTLGLLSRFGQAREGDDLVRLQGQVSSLEKQVTTLQTRVAQQDEELAGQQANNLTALFRPSEDPSSAGQVARTLVGQEQGFQEVVATLKLGMRDLAAMLPGSRSWLEQYNESLDQALKVSKARAGEVQRWAEGRAAEEPAAAPPGAPGK